MLELLFGNFEKFTTFATIVSAMVPFLLYTFCVIMFYVTSFVTKGESPLMLMSTPKGEKPPLWRAPQDDYVWCMISQGILLYSVAAAIAGAVLSVVIWYTPIWAYITLGAVAGLLFTARFAYTLKSKFDKHMQQLHKSADSKDYDVKF